MRRPALARTAAVAAAAALLAACANEMLPEPQPVEVDGPVPVVVEPQVERIRSAVAAAVEAADAALDPALLQPRVSGPALELRQARYAVRRLLQDQPAPPDLGGEDLADVAPAAQEWPRFFLVATRPEEGAVPRLQLLTQAAPREPYTLAAWVTLLPGVTLPEMPTEPPEVLPPDETSGLVASPAEVVARYSNVLESGTDSPYAPEFAEDAFRNQVLQEQQTEREAVTEFFGYSVDHRPRPDSTWAVRTEDGGALVIGVLNAARGFRVTAPGARLPLPADLAALAGAQEATGQAVVSSVEIVAFNVPPEGSEEPITVLGGERGVLSVAAS